jgi:N-carbamoyl-L-amino-acid hydrolase
MAMAQIGATPKGGVNRVALSDADKAGRDLFIEWCQQAGCQVEVDQMGNIFARRAGRGTDLPAVAAGSHLDSQPTGGKFDGVYGVLAALEVVETLNDLGLETERSIEVISWTNEEGARFAPAMVSSGVFAGEFDLDYGLSRQDPEGKTIGEELARIGYAGSLPVGGRDYHAAFELHIEQGPILEAQGRPIGIVTGVQGARWYDLVITGQEAHAGSTPMARRRDPVQGALASLAPLYELAAAHQPEARLTIGALTAEPGVVNTVPGRLTIKIDMRHPDAEILGQLDAGLRAILDEAARALPLNFELIDIWHSVPVAFDPGCVAALRAAAAALDLPALEMVSGAGHDAVYLSRVAPTAMIFIPCKDGLSHNEAESIEKSDATAGADVLLRAVLAMAEGD